MSSAKVARPLSIHTFIPEIALLPPKIQAGKATLMAQDDTDQWDGVGSWDSMKRGGHPKEVILSSSPGNTGGIAQGQRPVTTFMTQLYIPEKKKHSKVAA